MNDDVLISKAAAIEAIKPLLYSGNCVSTLINMPAVDAVPVVHGRIVKEWSEGWVHYQVCSECRESWSGSDNYCPNCGARIDGERGDGGWLG